MASRKRKVAVALAICLGGPATAADSAGNAARPWPLTDVFEAPPPRAHALPGTACVTAERYTELGNAKRISQIGALFAPDAVFLDPSGEPISGREAIGAWYLKGAGHNAVIPVSFIAAGRECFMEAASHIDADPDPRFRLLVIDHFTMNAKNEIARAVYYFRPNTMALAQRLGREAAAKNSQ
jgi:SnoaL-like domain